MNENIKPLILAPAGNKDSFLAAIAAQADAIYCGLKQFSARMQAKNFSVEDLAPLTRLAHDKGKKVYITFNSLIKPNEIDAAAALLDALHRQVRPDALIIQDLSLIALARNVGFSGEIHLSTLANVSFPKALTIARRLGVSRAVVPRELSIDEIRAMSEACPEGLELEVFVHGALCYGISGRCYWSSFLGGKSGLRGACVQPCRRFYTQNRQKQRFFSCQDLSADVLTKPLLSIPKIAAWKIEGRKKGPHYVFYTVQAYRMLRDEGSDPQAKKAAVGLLKRALGRIGTHYRLLPQRPQTPVNTEIQTGSGLFMGSVRGAGYNSSIIPAEELLVNDVLRVGYEDDPWHSIIRVSKYVPKKGTLHLKFPARKIPPKGTPVFLTDRREKTIETMLSDLEREIREKY